MLNFVHIHTKSYLEALKHVNPFIKVGFKVTEVKQENVVYLTYYGVSELHERIFTLEKGDNIVNVYYHNIEVRSSITTKRLVKLGAIPKRYKHGNLI